MGKYVVTYTDSREGELRKTEVEAEDTGEALEIAMEEDYYFGKLIEIEED